MPPGVQRSGDLAVVRTDSGRALVGVVDGIGHGEEAERAAQVARRTIEQHSRQPLPEILRHCHSALGDTRGVVMSLAELDLERHWLSWLGIGNVQGLLLRAAREVLPNRHELLLRAGVVGVTLPPLRADRLPILPFDYLILGTDGLRRNFTDGIERVSSPERLAANILERHCLGNDDALVLVAKVS